MSISANTIGLYSSPRHTTQADLQFGFKKPPKAALALAALLAASSGASADETPKEDSITANIPGPAYSPHFYNHALKKCAEVGGVISAQDLSNKDVDIFVCTPKPGRDQLDITKVFGTSGEKEKTADEQAKISQEKEKIGVFRKLYFTFRPKAPKEDTLAVEVKEYPTTIAAFEKVVIPECTASGGKLNGPRKDIQLQLQDGLVPYACTPLKEGGHLVPQRPITKVQKARMGDLNSVIYLYHEPPAGHIAPLEIQDSKPVISM